MSDTVNPSDPQLTITWASSKVESFKDALDRARKKREAVAKEYDWDGNRERYVPKPRMDGDKVIHDVNVGADFRDVERKKAALLFNTPDVSLIPDEPSRIINQPPPGQAPPPGAQPIAMGSLVSAHQELINGLLGPRHANAKPAMLKALFDVLCPAGVGVFKVGYDTRAVPVDQPMADPVTGMPMINPVTGQPLTQSIDLPIWEHWFLSRVSPKGLIIPADFRDTDHRNAPLIGYDYCIPASHARRAHNLGDNWKPSGGTSDAKKPYFSDEKDHEYSADDPAVLCTYVEYKAEHFAEPGVPVHPEQINVMVWCDDVLVKHEPHPDQSIGNDARLTGDSITEFTVQTLTLRDFSDSAWVASDSTATAALTKEINKYRTVTVQQLDGQRHLTLYDPSKLNAETVAKIDKGTIGNYVPVEPGALDGNPDGIMKQVSTIQQGRESYLGQDYIERDRNAILGIDANQGGQTTPTKRTATELSIVQRNSEARFEQERQRVLECYLRLVRIFDTLVLRYCDARNASIILGPVKGQLWAQHKQHLLGGYSYNLAIDSSKYLDNEAEKRNWLQLYNLTAKDPNTRRVTVLKKVAAAWGLDPAEWVVDQLPDPKPEPPKITFQISLDQFNPMLPQFPIVVEVARQLGLTISAESIQLAQQQAQLLPMAGRNTTTGEAPNDPVEMAGGSAPAPTAGVGPDPKAPKRPQVPQSVAEPADRLNQHQLNLTGRLPGGGVE